jgi:hypothetical protein
LGPAVESSRYLNARRGDRVGVEIGWIWLNPSVELKTDARNERSRGAMTRLPAQFEGIMRNHMIVPDVGLRDSAYFSAIDAEWPAVRTALQARLASR